MKITKKLIVPVAAVALALSLSTASAQVIGPRVALQFATNGLTSPLSASSSNAVIARLLLDTTGSTESVRLNSIPFNLITGSSARADSLRNCRVYNESDLSTSLNSSSASNAMFNGVNSLSFNSALILSPNTLTTLSLRCDIDSTLVSGGTYTINMDTSNVVATGASTGLTAAVTIRGSVVVPPVVVPPVVPGMPSTGASGEASQTVAMLVASILLASLGYSHLKLKKDRSVMN